MKTIPVALQLWSVREALRQDFASTLAAVAAMGYAGVELAGYGNLDAKGAKAALDKAGLRIAGMHVGAQRLRTELDAVISEALLLGSRHVTCSSWPAIHYTSAAACERIGEELGRIGAALRSYGIRFSFHNHAPELKQVDGRPALDWMLGAAAPRDLGAEADVYWLHVGGRSLSRLMREHGARCPLIHLKDEMELGLGPVDFDDVFSAIDAIGGVEWLIVEQEKYQHPPLESVRLCFEQMRRWGRA